MVCEPQIFQTAFSVSQMEDLNNWCGFVLCRQYSLNYKFSPVYFNKSDRRMFVPYTINFGHPWSPTFFTAVMFGGPGLVILLRKFTRK